MIIILATGGTFDKNYYDALSDYRIGEPQIGALLEQARVVFDYRVEALIGKDSLDMTDDDRSLLRERVAGDPNRRFVITHGTDTMADTARALLAGDAGGAVAGKTVVLTGAATPARFRDSDAAFNAGFALAAVQLLAPGVYVAMNGTVFEGDRVVKNRDAGRFEERARADRR